MEFDGSLAVVIVVGGIIGRFDSFPVMQLFENGLELFRDGQAEMRGVLQHGHALVGEVEADHGPAQRAAAAYDVQVYDCLLYTSSTPAAKCATARRRATACRIGRTLRTVPIGKFPPQASPLRQ